MIFLSSRLGKNRVFGWIGALLIVVAALAALQTPARASCSCACFNGQLGAYCTNTFDVAPICPATPCPRSSVLPPPSLLQPGGRPACREVRECDSFQRCNWKVHCS